MLSLISLFFLLFSSYSIQKIVCKAIPESELYSRVGWFVILYYLLFWLDEFNLLIIVLTIFAIGSLIDLAYTIFFRASLIPSSLEAIFLSNSKEAKEFISAYWDGKKAGLIFLFVALYSGAIAMIALDSGAKPTTVEMWVVVVLLSYVIWGVFNKKYKGVLPGFLGMLPTYISDKKITNRLIEARMSRSEEIEEMIELSDLAANITLVIIGESATRRHHQLYGYTRETTPFLSSISNNVIVFKDMISNFSQTNPSLSYLLTAARLQSDDNPDEALSFIDVANKAGIETWWLSNQEPIKSTPMAIAQCAKKRFFVELECIGKKFFDEELLPAFDEALASPAKNKLIVLHLMGSHLQYKERYPVEYNYFKTPLGINAYQKKLSSSKVSAINEYDNSIRYTDWIIREVHERLMQLNKEIQASMIYFSDHGEEVYDTRNFKGHEPFNYSKPMFEVPFWVWCSDSFQQNNKENWQRLQTMKNEKLQLDDFYHFVLHLSGVRSPLVQEQRSWLSKRYHANIRVVYGENFDQLFSLSGRGTTDKTV